MLPAPCSPATSGGFLDVVPYAPPPWAAGIAHVPPRRVLLAHTPTPVHRWRVPGVPESVELFIKRDDLTGAELSGNKARPARLCTRCCRCAERARRPLPPLPQVRKLEFLLADALAQECDCVVTIGGLQSNHARATAVAARLLGLDAHLILRTSRALLDKVRSRACWRCLHGCVVFRH